MSYNLLKKYYFTCCIHVCPKVKQIIILILAFRSGLYVSFLKEQGHQGSFFLVKGTLHLTYIVLYEKVVNFCWDVLVSSAPRAQGNGALEMPQ